MACLALSLQPANGPDLLLQTREWFPPARALTALSAFRQTRLSFRKHQRQDTSSSPSPSLLGDDPLAASSGQVVVGTESRFVVVYRLVNSVYVLGVSSADPDPSLNVFECIHTVNQAVSVVVAACRGVDVTPEKLSRKYQELYMALDLVLRGQVGPLRLSALLASIHADSLAKLLLSGLDAESRSRGALLPWFDPSPQDRSSTRSLLSSPSSSFELPPETLAAGDELRAEAAAAFSLPPDDHPKPAPEDHPSSSSAPDDSKDPFAASDALSKPPEEALVGGFKKTRDSSSADPTSALAGLDVTALPTSTAAATATKSTFIGVEGFEGDYGGIEYGNEDASLSETFEGFDDAFGGGLDPSEFVGTDKKAPGSQGLGGLELLATSSAPAAAAATSGDKGAPPPALDGLLVAKPTERKGPEMHIEEEISVEFRESLLARVALQGVIFLRTLPPPAMPSKEVKETEFSFRFIGTPGIKRVAVHGSRASSLGNGLFHLRTAPSDKVLPVLKYSLQPRFTPIPLRVRLLQRHSGTLLSVMIQYASNPELPQPLSNVTFTLKLPVDPTLLTVSPKGVLEREERELRWHVDEIPLKGPPGKLRARMPVDQDAGKGEEVEVVAMVTFSVEGASTLSGVSMQPATEGKTDFYMVNHRYATKNYLCN